LENSWNDQAWKELAARLGNGAGDPWLLLASRLRAA
jgi:hypothetical protein